MMKNILKKAAITSICAASLGLSTPALSNPDPFIGQMSAFGFNFAPRGWAHCNGQLLAISQNTALFSLLGTTYGGDGRTTFGLPDLRGRAPIHMGTGPGLSPVRIGQRGGSETVTLGLANLPSHSHTAVSTTTVHGHNAAGDSTSPKDNTWSVKSRTNIYSSSAPDVDMQAGTVTVATTVGHTGGGQSIQTRDPFLAVNWSIALVGVFPSRN